ncbi:MAG: hypothetical protein J0L82_01375 [Deltaproteobacteria bacterium]|jgi:hypothetical protein|nr:hypothetical protein [Deltaproteobacteria bacterium]
MRNKSLSRTQKSVLFAGFAIAGMIGLFQNCGSGFAVDPAAISASQLSSTGVTKVVGTSNADFKTCRTMTTPLFDCLESRSEAKGLLKAADVTRCTTGATPPSDLDVSICLTKAGFPIFNYREPLQWDIEGCASRVGTPKIATCLEKNAIRPASVTQAVIETCINAVGMLNVEKCLRKNGHLAKISFVSNSDAALCGKVTEQGTNSLVIRTCLLDREVIPATVLQADIDTCMTNAPTAIGRCLRSGRKVPRVIMQANINGCINAVGPTRIATCLEGNGYLYDSLLPAATLQTVIDDCVTVVGTANVARCLRARNVLERPILQAHIAACNLAAGQDKIVTCLAANGMLDASGLATNSVAEKPFLQADIDTCVTNVGIGSVATCMVGPRAALQANSYQAHFAACHRFNDPTGVAACLNGSGMLPATATQANFDTCLAAAGLAGLETCMRTRGFITYPAL